MSKCELLLNNRLTNLITTFFGRETLKMENKSKISQIIFLIMEVHIFTSRDKTQNIDMDNSFCKMPYKFNKTYIKCDAIF